MRITRLAIHKSMTALALMVILSILGIGSYLALPRESSPDVKIPFVMVFAPYYGTSPEDMENLVTRKLETQLKALPDLEEMTSTSSEGVSSIVLEFTTDVDMIDALQKVRDAVELAKPELPQDVRDDLLVYELSSDSWPIMQVVLSGDYSITRLKDVGEDLKDDLEQIKGVLAVDLSGGAEREIRIDVDPERLWFYGLSLDDVLDAIALENVTLPGGEIGMGTYEYQVRVPGEFEAVELIENVVVNLATSTPVYLRDLAQVSFGLRDRDTISRLGGVEAITLSVKKRSGENIIRIADEVKALLQEQLPLLPQGTHVQVLVDMSVEIRDMVRELEDNIISGLILVIAVLFLFLGFRNSLFVGMAIPMSMLISFVVLRVMDVTLNMVVLFSLILALGMLVDNAIVIVENIFRHCTLGMDRTVAANFGTQQVAGAVIASTVTTLCAFAPLLFWPGIMGEFMKYLPITLIVTLSASLLVAVIFNPVLCSRFMKVPGDLLSRKPGPGTKLMRLGLDGYRPVLQWALRHRAPTLISAMAIFVVVFALFTRFNAGMELFPDVEPTYAYVQIEAPSGTRIEVSDHYATAVEEQLKQVPDLLDFTTEVGAGGDAMFGGTASAPPHLTRLTMEFVKQERRSQASTRSLEELRSRLVAFTGAKLTIDKQENGPPTGKPINIEIAGDDFKILGELSEQIEAVIRDVPGVVDVTSNFDEGRPEILVVPDTDKAARLGLRTMDLARTVQTAIQGEDISEFRVGEDEYDIVVRFQQPFRESAEDLENLTVFYEGQSIPLTSFADVRFGTGLAAIHRIDGSRVITVTADAAAGFNANALRHEVQTQLAGLPVPLGYRVEFTGENEYEEESADFLSKAFAVALMLILVVLITQFDSVTVPVVIMGSVIMSLIGVFLGLMVMRMPFGIIMTGVGVISLAGIVVNNAIVLLDYVQQLRAAGKDKIEAILEAGETRFRPVILTAVTTILGLIPLTTGLSVDFGRLLSGNLREAFLIGGESSQWWGPMGVAVIWGLAVATFLTLVVVPVMYASLDPAKRALRSVFLLESWRKTARRSTATTMD